MKTLLSILLALSVSSAKADSMFGGGGGSSLSNPVAISEGGTNSATALNSNRNMVSSAGKIVEQSALTAGKMLFTDSNGLPAIDTWSYDSSTHILKSPVNSGNTTNVLQFGTNASNFIGTEDGISTQQSQRFPTGGRLLWYEGANAVMSMIPSSGFIQYGYYDGTHVFDIYKSIGKGVNINGTVNATAYENITTVGNVGAGVDDLASITTQAKFLATTKDVMEITAWGSTAANANLKEIKLLFGGTAISTIPSSVTYNNITWKIVARVIRTGNSTQKYMAQAWAGVTLAGETSGTLAITDTSAIIVKCTGEGVADNDIVQEEMNIKYETASPNGG